MRVDDKSVTSLSSEMTDWDSADLCGDNMMSDVRQLEEKKRQRNRVIKLCKDVSRPLNVAIIGPPGVGKSSLVNTIGAAFSDETWREYSYSGFHGDATQITVFTSSFSKCCHGNDSDYAEVKLPTLVDIAGFTDETGKIYIELLRIVFYGRLPEGESLAEAAEYAKEYGLEGLKRKYAANDEKLKVDRIIVVSSATSLVPTKLIQCVIEAARPSGLDEDHRRTIPLFGVLTKQDKIGSEVLSAEDYKTREEQFINAVGLKGSEHRFLQCRNYCNEVDHGRRTETVIPELDIPVLKFMCQVADPVFEVQNEAESYTAEGDQPDEDPAPQVRRRQTASTSRADATTEPVRHRIPARQPLPGHTQSNIHKSLSFYIQVLIEAFLIVLVFQFFLQPPVDMVKLRGYCNYVKRQNSSHDIEEICKSVTTPCTKLHASLIFALAYGLIRLVVNFVFEKFDGIRNQL